ncbi:MAG: HDOD domain-containing protein [Anaerolineae bacterium]
MPDSVYELLEQRVDDLVTMPSVAAQLFEKCSDPELKIADLVALIEGDQVVASRIMRLANSAYYGRSAAVSSLRDAVMLLGLESVRALGLGIGVYRLFETKNGKVASDLEQLWQHSIAVGLCAREIARRIGVRERDRAFVAGLLHDIGQLVLLQYLAERYEPIVRSIAVSGIGLETAERDALGTDHAEVGAWLLERWRLPRELCAAIRMHHADTAGDDSQSRPSLLAIVQVADWLATSQGLGPPWPRDRQRPMPSSRAALTLEDDALVQLCFGLDKRVSQLTEAMGLGPVSPEVFQRALYRANRSLAQMAIDLDSRGRHLQRSLDDLHGLQSVTAAMAGADDIRTMMEAALRALAAKPGVEYAQCMVPLTADTVLQGTAQPLSGGTCSVDILTCDRTSWERSREPRRLAKEYAEAAFRVLDGSQGILMVKAGADTEAAAAQCDLTPLAGVMGLAFERALAHRDLTALAQRRTEDLAQRPVAPAGPTEPDPTDHRLRLLGEMSAGAAHDLNNALAVMLGQAQLGLIAEDLDEVRHHLQTIERAAKDCATTVRRLQEFARGARKQSRDETFDLAAAARDTVEVTRPRWRDEAQRRGARIQVIVDLPEALPVRGSAGSLREVLTNLIFNAVDAMPNGGTIAIRGWREGREVHISIRDTGVGLSAEVKERLFEPFFTTKGDRGNGLGLSVCKRIVDEHGGHIEVFGRPGTGATFVLSLPAGTGAPEARREEAKAMGSRSLSVLVVDDEPQIREVLLRMLRLDGHTPTAANTAHEGIQAFGKQSFDLVLTDLGLPDMPGWEVIRAVKAANPSLPVVLITGWTEEEDRPDDRGGSGADAVLVKPFGIGELRQVIETATGGARQ